MIFLIGVIICICVILIIFFSAATLDIIDIALTTILSLAVITLTYIQVNQQERSVKMLQLSRIEDELRFVVEPLHARIEDKAYFLEGFPDRKYQGSELVYEFWDKIMYHKYLCPDDFKGIIEKYYYSKDNSTEGFNRFLNLKERDEIRNRYNQALNNLKEILPIRYDELREKQRKILKELSLD